MTTKNIMAGFRNMGIYPYDPLVIPPSSMVPSEVTMVRKVAFGVGFGVLLILGTFCRNSLLTFL